MDKYTWQDLGSSWILSDLLAAVLCAQLSDFEGIQERRGERWNRYSGELRDWALTRGYGVEEQGSGTGHIFYLIFPDLAERSSFIRHMRDHRILSVFHYQALHESPYASGLNLAKLALPVTTKMSSGLARLPLFPSMTYEEQTRIIASVLAFSR